MFHITPTPTSWMIWMAIWVGTIIIVLAVFGITYLISKNKPKSDNPIDQNNTPFIVATIIGLILLLITVGLAISSKYYNYTHSADYVKSQKAYKIQYDGNNQVREIKVLDFQGQTIYQYQGKFSFDRSGHGLNLVDNITGKKIAIYIGDNDSVIVTDK